MQNREVCRPGSYAGQEGVQAREMCRREGVQRCVGQRDAQAREVCKPGRCAGQGGLQVREVQAREVCRPQAGNGAQNEPELVNAVGVCTFPACHLFPGVRARFGVTRKGSQ